MAGSPERTRDLLRRAKVARAGGDVDAARAAFAKAYDTARQTHDVEVMTEAALGMSADHSFGTHPGRVPAFLFEAYSVSDGVARIRLAAALVRAWVYGGSPERGVPFAAEAVAGAEAAADPALLAEALDAQLLVNWGPDDIAERLRITSRLEDSVAHVAAVDVRMSAHLWRLTTAVEALDMPTVQRQLRALDRLADESGSARVRFFAEARKGMQTTVTGDLDQARVHQQAALRAGTEAGEADTHAIEHALSAAIARQEGDVDALRLEAQLFEDFGTSEGYLAVAVEAAALWLAAGSLDRARTLLLQVVGSRLSSVRRDVDWLLIVSRATETAAKTGEVELAAEGYAMLEPYAGRGIPNGGAAAFDGIVDGFLSEAATALGRHDDAARWARTATSLAERFGARWWVRRFGGGVVPPQARPSAAVLRPHADGVWIVGRVDSPVAIREMKGFHYLRMLLRQPGVEFSALDLSDWVAGHPGRGVDAPGTGATIDRQALAAYRSRLGELDAELTEVEQWADEGRLAKLRGERGALLDEIAGATGLGGRQRPRGATAERARVAVRKAVAVAIDRVTEVDASLGRVLRDCVQTGNICRYDPDPGRPFTWETG
ncbi:MAG: hypothetical protein QOG07_837 [Pseudonocardiales bacterium]|nr:hypothetical protein [Pseudonocardiales bacterium]